MRGTDPGSAREEAERLVATVLAAARLAAAGRGAAATGPFGALGDAIFGAFGPPAGSGGHDEGPAQGAGFATGSAECCVCPLCRVIAALRDPSPEFAERLATGAGDFAAGVASLMRSFAAAPAATGAGEPHAAPPSADTPRSEPDGRDAGSGSVGRDAASGSAGRDAGSAGGDVWAAATRAEAENGGAAAASADVADRCGSDRTADTTPMARKAVKRRAGAAAQDGGVPPSPGAIPPPRKAARRRVDSGPGGADGGPRDEA